MVPAAEGGIGPGILPCFAGFAMTGDTTRDGGGANTDAAKAASTDADLSRRLSRLDQELGQRRAADARDEAAAADPAGPSPLARGFRLSAEFVAGVGAGAILGWLLDRVLGSSPWGMIVLLMLGFCAGIYNVLRAAGHLRSGTGPSA
jgi:ATP synthase protein I